jgi:hypothetical protein
MGRPYGPDAPHFSVRNGGGGVASTGRTPGNARSLIFCFCYKHDFQAEIRNDWQVAR